MRFLDTFPCEMHHSDSSKLHSRPTRLEVSSQSISLCLSCGPSTVPSNPLYIQHKTHCRSRILEHKHKTSHYFTGQVLAPMEREDRLIWSVSEYSSSFGNLFVRLKTSCWSSKAFLYTFKSRKLSIRSLIRLPSVLRFLPSVLCRHPSVLRSLPSVLCLLPSVVWEKMGVRSLILTNQACPTCDQSR